MVVGYATTRRSGIIIKLDQSNLEEWLKEIRKIHLSKFPFSTALPKKYTCLANKLFNTVYSILQCKLILFEVVDNYEGIPLWFDTTLKFKGKKKYKLYTPNKEVYEIFHRRLSYLQKCGANVVTLTLNLKLSLQYENILWS